MRNLLENLVRRGSATECLRPFKDGLDENEADDGRMEGDWESLMVAIPAIVGLSWREKEREGW